LLIVLIHFDCVYIQKSYINYKLLLILKIFFVWFFLDVKFERVYKELFLLRELVRECFEDVKLTLLQNGNDKPNENEPIFEFI